MYHIEKVSEIHCNEMVTIHLEAFKGFFLTRLGRGFLKTYYESVINHPHGIAYCAIDDKDHLIGFCVGSMYARGFHKTLLKYNLFSFFLQGAIIFFTKPSAIYHLVKNLEKQSDDRDDGKYAELLSISVAPAYSGIGIGKMLLGAYEQELIDKGIKKNSLTTDYYDNESTLAFYKKQGYFIYGDFVAYPNRRMYRMLKNLVK